MEANKILTADLLDLVFEGRNKLYGAYELRQNYEKRLVKAVLLTAAICIVIAGGAWLKASFTSSADVENFRITEGVTIADIKEEKEPEPIPPPPPPPAKIEVPKLKTIDYTTPIVTDDKVSEPPPTQDEISNTRISNITQDGIADKGIVTPPEALDGKKGLIVNAVNRDEEDKIFTKVEIDASFPGGPAAWKRFLERNLDADVPVGNNAPAGTYTVIVEFVVDIHGKISQISPLTHIGFGLENEAME